MKLAFRIYNPADRPECMAIFSEHLGTYFAAGEAGDFQAFLDAVEAASGSQSLGFWLGMSGDRVVAFGGVSCNGAEASLNWGVVQRSQLRRGIGDKLIRHRISWIKTNHPEVKTLLCDTAPRTEGFFAKHGFITYRRVPNYWGGEIELVAMKLLL